MAKQITRRKFLRHSGAGSLVVLTHAAPFSVSALWAAALHHPQTSALPEAQQALLRAAADELIPAADGMPSASQAGALDYLNVVLGKEPELLRQVQAALRRLEALTKARDNRPFDALTSAQRIRVLQSFEREATRRGAGESLYSAGGNLFAALRDLVYEGYYTSPKVWPLLGYEFHPTSRTGPAMPPFDEAILAQTRKRPKSYREAQ